jgi:hypothetical protein
VELFTVPVNTALVTVEMPCPVLVETPNELVWPVATVEPVPVEFGEKVVVDDRGIVSTNLKKKAVSGMPA